MRKTIIPMGGIALLLAAGCGDDVGTMAERSDEVSATLEVLVEDTADHYAAIAGEDDLVAIRMLEEHFYGHTVADLDDLDYWVAQTADCRNFGGRRVELGNVDDHQVEARRQAALHRLVMALLVEEVDEAQAEEERYQLAMMAQLGELRIHEQELAKLDSDYLCP
jgi:hypothetical protein